MKPIITFNNIRKKYGKVTALDGISFNIYENDRIGFIGNNGCGKTTTINIMCNILNYNSGDAYAFGKRITTNYVSYKSRLGIVLSEPYYIDDFSVEQYWKFVCRHHKVPADEITTRIEDLIRFLKLTGDRKKRIHQLSSGNKSKVSIGGALLHNPELLILDEPFVNVDMETVEQVKELLKRYIDSKTLFITSHDLNLVIDLCTKFIIMEKGRVLNMIRLSDFENQDDLKNFIKTSIIKNNHDPEISWLKKSVRNT